MRRYSTRVAVAAVCLLGLTQGVSAQQQALPAAVGYVNDFSRVIDAAAVRRIQSIAQAIEARTGAQIAVATVASIQPYASVEQYAVALATKWGIGSAAADNGVLILLSTGDRQARIEVGYGLEGAIPDGRAGQILDQAIIPRFRAGDFSGGLVAGVEQVAVLIAQEYGIDPASLELPAAALAPQGGGRAFPVYLLLPLRLIGSRFFWPLLFMGGMGRRHHYGGGFGAGRGGGFSGFGGGGFGGGGASRGF